MKSGQHHLWRVVSGSDECYPTALAGTYVAEIYVDYGFVEILDYPVISYGSHIHFSSMSS